MADKKSTDTEIRKVFEQLGLSGSTTPIPPAYPAVPKSPPVYFPLSADSLDPQKISLQ